MFFFFFLKLLSLFFSEFFLKLLEVRVTDNRCTMLVPFSTCPDVTSLLVNLTKDSIPIVRQGGCLGVSRTLHSLVRFHRLDGFLLVVLTENVEVGIVPSLVVEEGRAPKAGDEVGNEGEGHEGLTEPLARFRVVTEAVMHFGKSSHVGVVAGVAVDLGVAVELLLVRGPVVVAKTVVGVEHGVGERTDGILGAGITAEVGVVADLTEILLGLADHHVAHAGVGDVAVLFELGADDLVADVELPGVVVGEVVHELLERPAVEAADTLLVGEARVIDDGVKMTGDTGEVPGEGLHFAHLGVVENTPAFVVLE